jgi:hypothetical protein
MEEEEDEEEKGENITEPCRATSDALVSTNRTPCIADRNELEALSLLPSVFVLQNVGRNLATGQFFVLDL